MLDCYNFYFQISDTFKMYLHFTYDIYSPHYARASGLNRAAFYESRKRNFQKLMILVNGLGS